jgi:hypothetical protein
MDEITIKMEEYKELLIIKGKYEELKSQKLNEITWKPPSLTRTYSDNFPKETYKITCKGE